MAVIPIVNLLKNKPKVFHQLVDLGLKLSDEKLLVTKTAGSLLFGYEDKLMKFLSTVDKKLVPSSVIGLFMNVMLVQLFLNHSFLLFQVKQRVL